jgi:hypothetical protein
MKFVASITGLFAESMLVAAHMADLYLGLDGIQ